MESVQFKNDCPGVVSGGDGGSGGGGGVDFSGSLRRR